MISIKKGLSVGFSTLLAAFLMLSVVTPAHATTQLFPVTVCHHTPGNNVTLTFQNWPSYSGHLGQPHNGSTFDSIGACASPTPTATPRPTVSEVCKPKQGGGWQWAQNYLTPPNFAYAGPNTYNVSIKNAWCNNNAPTPTPSATSSATPTATATATPVESTDPTPTATASATVAPSETPTATPTTEPTATPVAVTTSDNRSDGSQAALDCVSGSQNGRKDCNTAVGGGYMPAHTGSLPETGGSPLAGYTAIAMIMGSIGMYLRQRFTL